MNRCRNMIRYAAVAILAFATSVPLCSQIKKEFELMGGEAAQIRHVTGESCSVNCLKGGLLLGTRCTFYSSRHFGVFAQLEYETWTFNEKQWFGAVNKADGNKYLYRFRGNDILLESNLDLFAGAAFKTKCNGLDITSRLGFGAIIDNLDYSYERRSRDDSSGPEYYDIRRIGGHADSEEYLLDNNDDVSVPVAFAMKADVRFAFPNENRIGFMFAGIGLDMPVSRVIEETVSIRSIREHEPTNWVESVAWNGAKSNWIKDADSKTVTSSMVRIMPVVSINVGYCFAVRH